MINLYTQFTRSNSTLSAYSGIITIFCTSRNFFYIHVFILFMLFLFRISFNLKYNDQRKEAYRMHYYAHNIETANAGFIKRITINLTI